VDDSDVIRQLIRVNLELEGFEVVTAADGAECLEIVQQVQPAVVTLDVVMPRLDGLKTAACLRCDPRTRHLRIAIVSACTPAELDRGQSVGVDGYLGKPFEPVALVDLVRRLSQMPPANFRLPAAAAVDRALVPPGSGGGADSGPGATRSLPESPGGRPLRSPRTD
jgi:CheY-like chemotaxis protein